MQEVTKDIALRFCNLCNWVYEVWVTHRHLFDKNQTPEEDIGKAKHFTSRLAIITQEYCIQQIAKLHDPAVQGNSHNLSIDFILQFGNWGEKAEEIKGMQTELAELWEHLKPARNKALAHNDLDALMEDAPLGQFPEGADEAYFAVLQNLVNAVSEKWGEGSYAFNDLAGADVEEFLAVLRKV